MKRAILRYVSLGIDVEPDCPPYLATQYRGVTDGLPKLLDVLDASGVRTTCFCTGQVAERFPQCIHDIVARGHELACHGHTHRPFDGLTEAEARDEIETSSSVLRSFGPSVTSFRAPNLRFPERYLPLLECAGFRVDSSAAKYKRRRDAGTVTTTLARFPASTTSSVLRLPAWIRDPWLMTLASPAVLFVHPWECVNLTRERLRLDCRFRTGEPALRAISEMIASMQRQGTVFLRMMDLPSLAGHAAA